MKIPELLKKYNFHDSVVTNYKYCIDEEKIVFYIDLCNWLQSDYIEGRQEIETGKLIFTGITFFEIKPSNVLIKDNEILEVKIIQDLIKEKELLKIVVNSLDDVIIFYIQANNVEWIINDYIN